jgi:hypothetical protein
VLSDAGGRYSSEGTVLCAWQPLTRGEAAMKLADVLVKTLASALLPGPAGTFVGEALGKGLDLLSGKVSLEQAKLARQIEGIALSITSSALDPNEFVNVPPNDLEAAVLAVSDTLSTVPITGALLRESGYSALRLARYYQENAREIVRQAQLGEAKYAFDRILESVSHQVVAVLRVSPEAHAVALADLTTELQSVQRRLDNPGGLYSQLQHAALDEYLLTYRLDAGKQLAKNRRSTSGGVVRWLPTTVAYVEQRLLSPGNVGTLQAMLEQQRRVLVEADPGQGKSVLLRQAFLRSLAQHGGNTSLIPIYIDLRETQQLPTLEEVVPKLNKWLPKGPDGWIDRVLREGKALVLLDNLEDLLGEPSSRSDNEADLGEFISNVIGDSAVVMAARPGTLNAEWIDYNVFATAQLASHSKGQAFEQIRSWHEAIALECDTVEEQKRVSERGEELQVALSEVSDLMGLCRNPLFCSLLCEAFLDSSLALPQDWIALFDDVLQRLASWDARSDDSIMYGSARVREIHRAVAVWAVHNEPPFDGSHLADAVSQWVEDWGVEWTPEVVVRRILAQTSVLRREGNGLAFTADELRDHLAAGDLISSGNVNYLRTEARRLSNPRLIVAAAGRARQERAAELVAALLEDADENPDVSDALIVTAFCCANASRTLDKPTHDRVNSAAAEVVHRGNVANLLNLRVVPLALDMLTSMSIYEGSPAATAMAVEIAASLGETAFPILRVIAKKSNTDVQDVMWRYWSSFNIRSYAREVLSFCVSAPKIVVIDAAEKFAALADLPQLTTVEVVCPVDATQVRGRGSLTVRTPDVAMIASPDHLGPGSSVVEIREEDADGSA